MRLWMYVFVCGYTSYSCLLEMTSSSKSMLDLVASLISRHRLTSPRTSEVMSQVDRADFVHSSHCYEDRPLPIGFNATISAPHMHAYALDKLEGHLKPGAKVLDVGSGSGYLSVCMAVMTGPNGRVVGVEHIPELVNMSLRSTAKHHNDLIESQRLRIVHTDGRQGWPAGGPYDVIHVGAACPEVPRTLIDQLSPKGRLLLPVGDSDHQNMLIVDKDEAGLVTTKKDWGVIYIPLTSRDQQCP